MISLLKKKRLIKLIILLLLACTTNAQIKMENNSVSGSLQSNTLLPASATASLFNITGQTSVSNFTGTANIYVPLTTINYKELNIDLSLSYQYGNGIKPDFIPGPCGMGWLLNSGGVITRLSKGITPVSFPNPEQILVGQNLTAATNWSSPQKMQDYIEEPTYILSSENQYDEFSYNFSGLSGKFYTNYTGQRFIKSQAGEDLKVDIELIANPTTGKVISLASGQTTLWQCPYRFIITDSKGVKFIFGGTDNSIELTRPGRSTQGSVPEIPNDQMGKNTVPVSWYLTSIESPNGYKIELEYDRGDFYITSQSSCNGFISQFSKWNFNASTVKQPKRTISSYLINPCYLKRIITPLSITELHWSLAPQQLGYKFQVNSYNNVTSDDPSWNPDGIDCNVNFSHYLDIGQTSLENRFPSKLDRLTVSDKHGNINKNIRFSYTNNTTTRLKLNSVLIRGKDDSEEDEQSYSFSYNSIPLPDYLSFSKDIYGYYNGQNTYITVDNPNTYLQLFTNPTSLQSYIASRAENFIFTQAEILQKVTYPTGGYSIYEYENHDYSRVASNWPPTTTENPSSSTKSLAGLRIKKISKYTNTGNLSEEKKYFYIKNYASGIQSSSGVLNYIPRFSEEYDGDIYDQANVPPAQAGRFTGNLIYKNFGTEPINPISYNKRSHVTYSEVAEVDLDGGYTVYKYKNYDNGYADRPPQATVYDNKEVSEIWKEDDSNCMEIERGQLLSKHTYASGNILKQELLYEYNNDASRLLDNGTNIRILKCFPNPISSADYNVSLRYIASLAYTYYPYLKKKTETIHENGASITTISNYIYNSNNKGLASEAINNSKNDILSIQYKYPVDMVALGQSVPYSSMLTQHITGPVIIKEQYKNTNTLLKRFTYNYKNWEDNIFYPETIGFQYGNYSLELSQTIYSYDNYGNILERSGENNIHETYLWGYKGSFPVARIIGSSYLIASQYVDQNLLDNADNSGIYDDAAVRAELNKLRINLPNAQVKTMTYSPFAGLTSETDEKNRTTFYEYDNFNRLKIIRDHDNNIVKRICYNYSGQVEECFSLPVAQPGTTVYAKIFYENPAFGQSDVVVRFFLDGSCTQPVIVNDMDINYSLTGNCLINSGVMVLNDISGSSKTIAESVVLTYPNPFPPPCNLPPAECPAAICTDTYTLLSGTGYTVVP